VFIKYRGLNIHISEKALQDLEFTTVIQQSSFESDNRIPNHGFDNIYEQLKRLTIEDSYIETESFLKIATTSETIKELKKYFKKFHKYQ